ncbi:VanW family protein [Nocardioides cheoyonin]|uniref:VanW family protein n=1 Tax=Nocardioides cheoyonin TaxID=3156615 RepID=UPI0032B5F45A
MTTDPAGPDGRTRAAEERKERPGGKAVVVVLLALALLVGGGWFAAYHFASDRLPHGTRVAGVDVGDRTPAQAARTLRAGLADRMAEPVTVLGGGTAVKVNPAAAGLSLDAAATVASGATGRSWDPRTLWDHYTDGSDLQPVVDVDAAKLAATARRIDQRAGRVAVDGAVSFAAARVKVTDPVMGRGVDEDELAAALRSAYLSTGDRRVEVGLHDVPPAIDDAAVEKAVDDFANPAMSAPVTLVFGRSPVRIAPRQYAGALTLVPKGDRLVPVLDRAKLRTVIAQGLSSDRSAPVDATVRLVGGKPRVIPAKPGVSYDLDDVADVFLKVVTWKDGHRWTKVRSTVAEPDFTTAEARALRIRRKVSEFTTHFPYAEYRNVNIGRAAELIDGTVLKPGDTFSLNGIVGERTAANGFTTGWTIQNGIFRQDYGGGVSQLATTTFNAMFFAGLEDVEHKPHSLYIDRYPIGREATVAWPSVDLRFRNDTPYGVLVHATVTPSTPSSQGSVTVSMWSTKHWDITTRTGPRYAFTAYKTQTITDGNCEDTSGADGFSIDVWRYFHRPGSSAVVKTEKFHTTYIPQDHVICRTG